MQQRSRKYIFDLDGTLYTFGSSGYVTFGQSLFYTDLRQRILIYIAAALRVSEKEAQVIFNTVHLAYNGELSIGLEKMYGLDRYEYYAATWNAEASDYITVNSRLADLLEPFRGHTLLLTAAPRIWADKVLEYLGLSNIFGENIITGEPDVRKPDPAVFWQAAGILNTSPEHIVSIGDQNYSDILPAKSLGMTTILIGPEQLDAHH